MSVNLESRGSMLGRVDKENDLGLLDLLVVVAENIRLLVLGPILMGLFALGIGYLLPPHSFTSQAIVSLPATPLTSNSSPTQAAAMMVSPLVLDAVIDSLQLTRGRTSEKARLGLAGQIKAAVGKDGLLHLDVTADTPAEAQSIARTVISAWLKTTVPGKLEREELEKRLTYAKDSLDSVRRLLDRLTSEGSASLSKAPTRGESGFPIVAVGELQTRYLTEVLAISRQLQGVWPDVVVQPPTLPTDPSGPPKSMLAILTALASGFVLLFWIFVRLSWKNAARNPQTAERQTRFLAALRLKAPLR